MHLFGVICFVLCLFFKSACFVLKGCFISGVSDETDVFWKKVDTRLYRYNVV